MLELETLFVLMNAVLYEYGPRFCLYKYGESMAQKIGKAPFIVFLRKSLTLRTKIEILEHL